MNFERDIARVFVRAAIWHLSRRSPAWVLVAVVLLGVLYSLVKVRAETLSCHDWQGIHYCDGPHGYRSEEHDYQGRTYGRDSQGNAWEIHQWGGNTYTTQTRKGRP